MVKQLTCNHQTLVRFYPGAPNNSEYIMSEEKKSKNPFIAAVVAAKAAATGSTLPPGKAAKIQSAKFANQVSTNKPTKKSAGRGR